MRRNATLSLDAFDPDVLDAARDAARRAGMPLESWIASVVGPGEKPPARRKRRAAQAEHQQAAAPPQAPRGDPLAAAMAEMMSRLEAIDRKIAREAVADRAAATRLDEAGAVARAPSPSATPASEMAERLAAMERRMSEIGEQIAAPRPLGRRGRPVVTDVRDAVTDIRQRQRELDGAAPAPAARPSSPAISDLQLETTRLRESIGGLATGRDVGALEAAMQALASGVSRAQEPADLAAIAAPIEMIRAQVDRLAEDVAENVHARVASDVERLAAKVDGALSGGAAGFAERDALGGLFAELDEIRRLIAALAGPERIQSLAQSLQAISGQIAELQSGDGAGMADLRPLLEEIRSGMRPGAAVGAADSDAIIHRIDALADKVERAGINPVGDLLGRLEDLGETLRRPPSQGGDLASIHGMLRDLAEKLDRSGAGARGEGLDALEKQVLALADRIDTRGADPALASLERTMSDLLAQVSAQRAEAPAGRAQGSGEAGEIGLLRAGLADLRAHQAASEQRMQSTLNGVHTALDRLVSRLGAIESDGAEADPFADRLMATTSLTSQRAGHRRQDMPRQDMPRAGEGAETLDLSRLTDEPLEPGAGRPGVAAPAPKAAASPKAPSLKAPSPKTASDEEPAPFTAAPANADIKTSFIAAARRAAQAAQAEVAASSGGRAAKAPGKGKPSAAIEPDRQRSLGLRAEIDKRRRPLLLGLAAIVLALGALQAIRAWTPPSEPQTVAEAPAKTFSAPVVEAAPGSPIDMAAKPSDPEPKAEASSRPDPQTTQSIGEAAKADAIKPDAPKAAPPVESEAPRPPARSAAPRVASMSGLAGDLSSIPTGFVKLRQAALDGDGAAIFELAAREAEGRGMPRDLAVAAKLYEKLAAAGYAPAQHRLAAQYEKGSGVARDLAQAKIWYGRAADQGNARAMHNLAVIHAENPTASGKPDYATAAQWFRRAAEYGVRDSQYNLAVLCARGLGVKQDLAQSYAWFSAAAAQGDEDAGKKRDDVAGKLNPKDLAIARELAAAFKPKAPEPAVNEPPAPSSAGAAGGAVTLMGAPPPSAIPAPRPRA